MRLAVLGFGLIGGSIAQALAAQRRGTWNVTAWAPSEEGTRRALRQGKLAARAPDPETAVRGVDLVVLAAPPTANLDLLERIGPLIAGGDTTLTDVTSSQGAIGERAARIPGLHFVGGHPMSGRERRGYTAATPDLFRDRPWVVVPGPAARARDIGRVMALAGACGAQPIELEASEHDRAVAAVSHLPLVASLALAETVSEDLSWELSSRLAAQGWRDMTRLARGDVALGSGIVRTNAPAISEWLARYRATLSSWQQAIDEVARGGAPSAIEQRMETVRGRIAAAAPAPAGPDR